MEMVKLWNLLNCEQGRKSFLIGIVRSLEWSLVCLVLASQSIEACLRLGAIDQILDDSADLVGVIFNANDILALLHYKIELFVILSVVLGQSVDLSKLANGLEKLVCGTSQLRFEEGEPEKLGIDVRGEDVTDLTLQVGIYDILHIN